MDPGPEGAAGRPSADRRNEGAFFFDRYLDTFRGQTKYRFFWEGPPGGKAQLAGKSADEKKAIREQREKARLAWEVTGWRIYYQIGVEERWFEGQRQTPYASVLHSDWRTFAANLCRKLSRL